MFFEFHVRGLNINIGRDCVSLKDERNRDFSSSCNYFFPSTPCLFCGCAGNKEPSLHFAALQGRSSQNSTLFSSKNKHTESWPLWGGRDLSSLLIILLSVCVGFWDEEVWKSLIKFLFQKICLDISKTVIKC